MTDTKEANPIKKLSKSELDEMLAHTPEELVDLQTINASELGKLIGRSTKSIMVDACRRPETLPPRFRIPGTRRLMWRVVDVREWMNALAAIQAEQRAAAREFARKQGITDHGHKSFVLGHVRQGAAATARMKADQAKKEEEQ